MEPSLFFFQILSRLRINHKIAFYILSKRKQQFNCIIHSRESIKILEFLYMFCDNSKFSAFAFPLHENDRRYGGSGTKYFY